MRLLKDNRKSFEAKQAKEKKRLEDFEKKAETFLNPEVLTFKCDDCGSKIQANNSEFEIRCRDTYNDRLEYLALLKHCPVCNNGIFLRNTMYKRCLPVRMFTTICDGIFGFLDHISY